MSKLPFNRIRVTRLLRRYVRHPKNIILRDKIILLSLPLIEAALSRQGMFDKRYRDDIRQECALKLIQALKQFKYKRGDAFGFIWTVSCNMSKTINERLHRPSYSLSSDEDIQKEAEASGKSVFNSPENQCILNSVSEALVKALTTNGFQIPRKRLHRRACRSLQKSITSGELFTDKPAVVRRLKRIGLERKDIQYYMQYSLVTVREKLMVARENVTAISQQNYAEPMNIAVLEDL